MKQVNEARLETDLNYRFHYLAEFIGFGAEDVAAIHAAAPVLAPPGPDSGERRLRTASPL
jgi:hypothetical protein